MNQVKLCLLAGITLLIQNDSLSADLQNELKRHPISSLVHSTALSGDKSRGESIFRRVNLACVKCHEPKQGSNQNAIGPNLTFLGDRREISEIIESIIDPNAAITEGFQSYVVLTRDGVVVSGVLKKQTSKEVVLSVLDQGETRISTDEIESLRKAESAMPKDLVNQLNSKQEFYDLIAYLKSRQAAALGTPIIATKTPIIREMQVEGQSLPILAVARPDGFCFIYDPNHFRLDSFWKGTLGWITPTGEMILNRVKAKPFHIRSKPWMGGVGKDGFKFDYRWIGYRIDGSRVVMKFELEGKPNRGKWIVEESLEIPSPFLQEIKFKIEHPTDTNDVLTFWLQQTNFRSVATNGQQAQRNQLEFLKPGQTEFTLTLSRRREVQTLPEGYSVTKIDIPKTEYPFRFEPTAFDFTEDGAAFISTRTGSIWRYQNQDWNQFATGLQETQGVRVAENGRDVYTMQKPELTLLEDTDNDGRADFYRSIANGFRFTGQYHEFAYGPVINRKGEIFFSTGLSSSGNHEAKVSGTGQMSSALGYRGWMMKVEREGRLSPFASGLRSPAGIGLNAQDDLFITDNQGDWVASSYLGHVEQGDFLGHPATLWDREEYGLTPRELNFRTVSQSVETVPKLNEQAFKRKRKRPAVWLIHGDLTNSPGNPSFCPPRGFGPFEGQAFIADISHRAIVRVALERVKGQYQGAVFPFIRPLESASYSTAFAPDGSLWVGSVGRGWTTGDPMIEVITFDKKKQPFEMQRIELTENGFDIHFTQPLDPTSIPKNLISIKRFHYLYWAEYGSDRQENERVELQSWRLSPDQKILSMTLPLVRDKIYEIDLGRLFSSTGMELKNHFAFYTLNELLK